jgi:RHS repeat-associated protein
VSGLYDGLTSTTDLTDSSGGVTTTYGYDVFGATRSQSGTSDTMFRFTGEQLDADSGLYYLRARYYDAAIGRFLARDAAVGFWSDPRTLSRYVYSLNDPVNLIDPYGLFGFKDIKNAAGKAVRTVREATETVATEACKSVSKGAEVAVDYITDPYNIATGIQFASLVAMKLGCPTAFTNAVSATACGLGSIAYVASTYYKWDSNCSKVRQGTYTPLEAKMANIIAVGPLPGGVTGMLARSGLKSWLTTFLGVWRGASQIQLQPALWLA